MMTKKQGMQFISKYSNLLNKNARVKVPLFITSLLLKLLLLLLIKTLSKNRFKNLSLIMTSRKLRITYLCLHLFLMRLSYKGLGKYLNFKAWATFPKLALML